MTTSKFQVRFLNQYLIEIFGRKEATFIPLVLKNISQKTKHGIRKLGEALRKELTTLQEQVDEIYKRYSEEYIDDKGSKLTRVKEEDKEAFNKEIAELDNLEIEVSHIDFEEKDFIDKDTGEVVGDTIYFNIIDILVYDKITEEAS